MAGGHAAGRGARLASHRRPHPLRDCHGGVDVRHERDRRLGGAGVWRIDGHRAGLRVLPREAGREDGSDRCASVSVVRLAGGLVHCCCDCEDPISVVRARSDVRARHIVAAVRGSKRRRRVRLLPLAPHVDGAAVDLELARRQQGREAGARRRGLPSDATGPFLCERSGERATHTPGAGLNTFGVGAAVCGLFSAGASPWASASGSKPFTMSQPASTISWTSSETMTTLMLPRPMS